MRAIVMLLSALVIVGCDNPIHPDDHFLIVHSTGPYVGLVIFDDGHVMKSFASSATPPEGSRFPLVRGEALCWSLRRTDDGAGFLSAYAGDSAGRRRLGFSETTSPGDPIGGCAH